VVPKGNPGDTQGGQGAHTQGLILMRAQARSPPPRSRLWFSIGSPSLDRRTLGWAWVGPGLGLGWAPGPRPSAGGHTQGTPKVHFIFILMHVRSASLVGLFLPGWPGRTWENLR
jgi:hypothetical protein